MSNVVSMAAKFAALKHSEVGQLRKYTGEPYIVHPAAVARIVSTVQHDDNMLAAAWLHDTIEDTNTTSEEIFHKFGGDISSLVDMLTDVSVLSDGNRAHRKKLDCDHLSLASDRAKTIKLADLIQNSESIIANDSDFAKIFIAEKAKLLSVLVGGDRDLMRKANQIVETASVELGISIG